MRKFVHKEESIYALCVIAAIGWCIAAIWTQEDPEEPGDPYESCTRMSEDLYLCDGEFCNPSTGVCNHILPLD